MSPVLAVQNLNKTFKGDLFEKDRLVLNQVSFQLAPGTTVGFIGSNGAGKTTTIKCIFDFIRPDSGEILFFGHPLSISSKTRIGYLPERPYLYEFLTGIQLLRLHWDLCYGTSKGPQNFQEQAQKVLQKVGLLEAQNKKLRAYSKGMLQRIGLAQAILTEPDLLILDEPMSGLDPDGRDLVKQILRQEQSRGVTIFFSSHLLQDMEELCSDLVVINRGKILYEGGLKNFMSEYQSLEKAFSVLKAQKESDV